MRTLFLVGLLLVLVAVRVIAQCPGDFDHDGTVAINEIVTAGNNSLVGCPTPGPQFVDNGDGTITDNENGLMWETLSFDDSIHSVTKKYSWNAAVTDKIAKLNTSSFAGHSDWRLPTIYELETLIDYGQSNPSTYAAFNRNCGEPCHIPKGNCSCTDFSHGPYWSSTEFVTEPSEAWGVLFGGGGGYVSAYDKTLLDAEVRAVRGGS